MREEIADTLRMAVEYIDNIKIHVPKLIENYRKYQIEQASEQMRELSEGLLWIEDVWRLTKQESLLEYKSLLQTYKEMLEAMENQDYLLIADLLEYELTPMLAVIQDQIYRRLEQGLN